MPPRYAYWTILIDQQPTAFRARDREELLPTLNQLRRKNPDVVLKWFARGALWESPAAAQAAQRAPRPASERRGRDWRPGGEHRDPRDRFKKAAKASTPPASGRAPKPWQRDRPGVTRHRSTPRNHKPDRPWRPSAAPAGRRRKPSEDE